jgi:uncharacterized membrane protein
MIAYETQVRGASMRDVWLEAKFEMAKKYGWVALLGVIPLVLGLALNQNLFTVKVTLFFIAAILIIPVFFYLIVFTIWHWKHRYRGEHSDLWGAVLLVETSGWFKLIYWFRHIIPDWRGTGRYAEHESSKIIPAPSETGSPETGNLSD